MPARRSKPLIVWEPLPYLVLFALVLVASVVSPERLPLLFWPLVVVIVATAAWMLASLVAGARPANPDRWGDLASLDGIEVRDAPRLDRGVRAVATVTDSGRHQPSIELARLFGGAEQAAVLIPHATRWMTRRYRVGVQLVGGTRPRHAGFLDDGADARWRDLLDALARQGAYVRVPALIVGETRPFKVELDLGGLALLEGEPPA